VLQGSARDRLFERHIEHTRLQLVEVQSLLTNQTGLIDGVAEGVASAHRAAQGIGRVSGHSFMHIVAIAAHHQVALVLSNVDTRNA
jgi:hypothetical protein